MMTLKNMKRYFQVEDHFELLKFIKKNGPKKTMILTLT